MLTTTVDGLWVLQVLCRTERLAPELGLRPHLPSAETAAIALAHPMAAELRDAGVINADGEVDEPVREWLAVLDQRHVALLLYAQHPRRSSPERILLAVYANWWVALERCDHVVRLSGVGMATGGGEASRGENASRVISAQIDRLLGPMPAAPMRSATIDTEELLRSVTDERTLRRYLAAQRCDPEQIMILTMAADITRCPQASLVVIHPRARGSRMESGAVTIMDTPRGRVLAEHIHRDGRQWMIVGPGSPSAIAAAIPTILHRSTTEEVSR